MKNLIRWGLAGATAVMLLMPGRAHAQTTLLDGIYSGGSNFATQMDVELTYSDTGLFTLTVQNLGYWGEVFTRVALVNVPEGLVFSAGQSNGWIFEQTNLTGDGIPSMVYLYWAGPSPIENGIAYGEQLTFTFQAAADWESYALDGIGAGVHAQAGPETCSTKFAVWNGGADDNDGAGEGQDGYDPDCVSVPEPGSNALLAIGIFGMAFVAVRRRSLAELMGRA